MRYRNATFLFSLKEFFRKPTFNSLFDPFGSPCRGQKPSLPLRKAPPFSPSLSSIVFTTPSVPLVGDRNPQGREDVTALSAELFESPRPSLAKEGSTSHPSPLSSEERDVTALRCSEPLRYKDGGPKRSAPGCAGWDRWGNSRL